MSKLFRNVLIFQIVVFGLTAAAISFENGRSIYKNLTREFQSKGTAIARSISYSAIDTLVNGDLSSIQAVIDQFKEMVREEWTDDTTVAAWRKWKASHLHRHPGVQSGQIHRRNNR